MLQSSISLSIPVLKVNLYSKNLFHIEFYVFMFLKLSKRVQLLNSSAEGVVYKANNCPSLMGNTSIGATDGNADIPITQYSLLWIRSLLASALH